jgi:hypothetical protein
VSYLHEPISVQPFVAWYDHRHAQVKALYDNHRERMADAIGMRPDSCERRLTRYRSGETKAAERQDIEDMLWTAGVFFWEVYTPETEREWRLDPAVVNGWHKEAA